MDGATPIMATVAAAVAAVAIVRVNRPRRGKVTSDMRSPVIS
jgi:hypothetical protein